MTADGPQPSVCGACGTPVPPNDAGAFCRDCGAPRAAAPTPRQSTREKRRLRRRVWRRGLADFAPAMLLFLGTLGILLASGWLAPEWPSSSEEAWITLAAQVAILGLGLGLWAWLRRPTDLPLLGEPGRLVTAKGLALGLVGGLVAIALATAWLALPGVALDEPWPTFGVPEGIVVALLVTAVTPAITEELTDRGVAWCALARFQSGWALVLTTAILFALLHGLNGGAVFEFPHRFLAGVVFGWLRLRTGSLLPAMVAHFTNNAIACFMV